MSHDPRLFAGRLLVLDTETTGLSPEGGDRVVEIGCVELVDCVPTGREYHTYLNPLRAMPPGAERVHGLSDAFLRDQPVFPAVVEAFLAFVGEADVIAHNAAFDIGFLDCELRLCGRAPITMARAICTVELAKRRLPGAKHSLDALCLRYGVDRTHRVKHGALLDAKLLAEVYLELIGGRQIGLALAQPALAADAPVRVRRAWPARPHAPLDDELAAHAAFIATLTDPLWNAHARATV